MKKLYQNNLIKITFIVIGIILLILIISNPSNSQFGEFLDSKGYPTKNAVLQKYNKKSNKSENSKKPNKPENSKRPNKPEKRVPEKFSHQTMHNYGRQSNYFIFSTYKYNDNKVEVNYWGILGNFYELD